MLDFRKFIGKRTRVTLRSGIEVIGTVKQYHSNSDNDLAFGFREDMLSSMRWNRKGQYCVGDFSHTYDAISARLEEDVKVFPTELDLGLVAGRAVLITLDNGFVLTGVMTERDGAGYPFCFKDSPGCSLSWTRNGHFSLAGPDRRDIASVRTLDTLDDQELAALVRAAAVVASSQNS